MDTEGQLGFSNRSKEIVQRRGITMTKGVKLQLGDHLIQAVGKQLEYKQTCLQPAGSDQLELASTGGCGDGAVTGFK